MEFILKKELLPIYSEPNKQLQPNAHHFYDFQAKQMKEKEALEEKRLMELIELVEEEEVEKEKKKNIRNRLNLEHTSQAAINKHYQDFYEKNKQWKESLQREIYRKQQKKQHEEKLKEEQSRIPLGEREIYGSNGKQQQQQYSKHSESYLKHNGPVSNWNERFHHYIQSRMPEELDEKDFIPKINKKSRFIASRMVGKVEDRLIRFGEVMRVRKHEMAIEEIEKVGKLPESSSRISSGLTVLHSVSTDSNQEEFFNRLYREAEIYNRKQIKNEERFQYSFKPSINQLPQEMESKVNQKREKYPLYSSKKLSSRIETNRFIENICCNKNGKPTQVQFDNFLKRNEALLEKKVKNENLKIQGMYEREKKDMEKCTFIPELNQKSIKIFENSHRSRFREYIEEDDVEGEDSYNYSKDNDNDDEDDYIINDVINEPSSQTRQEQNHEEEEEITIEENTSNIFSNINHVISDDISGISYLQQSPNRYGVGKHINYGNVNGYVVGTGSSNKFYASRSMDEPYIEQESSSLTKRIQENNDSSRITLKNNNNNKPSFYEEQENDKEFKQNEQNKEHEQNSFNNSYMDSLEFVNLNLSNKKELTNRSDEKKSEKSFISKKGSTMKIEIVEEENHDDVDDEDMELTFSNKNKKNKKRLNNNNNNNSIHLLPNSSELTESFNNNNNNNDNDTNDNNNNDDNNSYNISNKSNWENELDIIKNRLKGLIKD